MKILSVVGARPNFMKIAPFIRAIEKHNSSAKEKIEHLLVHTGQHYDDRMSKTFFEELSIPEAEINLGVGSGSHAEQVGMTMIKFEEVLKKEKPDWVVVVGDVNAILACSVTAKKENIKCCHIEAGLRSGDMSMPEEINRLVADRICDLLLTPDRLSSENLRKEGIPESRICFTGNIMIDTLDANHIKAAAKNLNEVIENNRITDLTPADDRRSASANVEPGALNLEHRKEGFAVLTLHRPSNVDTPEVLGPLTSFITDEVCSELTLLWTLHPRTRKMLEEFGLFEKIINNRNLILLEPLSYLDMLRLNMDARLILTDSGGLQEECTVLGTPCLTLRWNTERPVTLREHGGASVLTGNNIERIRSEFRNALTTQRKPFRPELWDGRTAERCLSAIIEN